MQFWSEGNLVISEGDTAYLPVYFSAELANPYSAILTIPTSDPYQPTVEVELNALAISELSGPLCGDLSIINSPY